MFQFFYEPAPVLELHRNQPLWPEVQLAVSASWRHGSERMNWILANGLGCAFAPNPDRLDSMSSQLDSYIRRGMSVRYHGYFPGKEIGHAHPGAAEDAMRLHFNAIDAMRGVGEQLMTVHVGLDPTLPLNPRRAVKNLTRLVRYGKKAGVAISLENLRRGPTSDPRELLEWARRSGSGITLDVGHAVSSQCVRRKEIRVEQIVDLVAERLAEVHLYESETDRHWAPLTMDILGPIVDKLIAVDCRWWTIELEDTSEVLNTRQLLADYFETAKSPALWRPKKGAGCVLPE